MKRIVLKQLARQVLERNQYMTLATINPDGGVWAAPVVYAPDPTGKLYFLSQPESRHSRQIEADGRTAVTIFNSQQRWGEGVGLQMEGRARKLPFSESVRAGRVYFGRKWPYPGSNLAVAGFKQMVRGKIYRFYEVTPEKVWLNDPRAEKDVRVKVRI